MELTDRDHAILEFEAMCWQLDGPKRAEIRARFALSTTRYYQLLNELLDSPEALTSHPLVVRRLQRERTRRRRVRFEGPSASQPPAR